MDHSVVQRWLRSVIGPYLDKDRVFADVDRTLIAVSSLSPKTEVFTFNDGRTQLLLTLEGTIPVQFRNSTYNIPVAYWIPREYPRGPPMGFVVPTADMGIRKGPNVDPSGQIGGAYIGNWGSKPEACNLLDFIHDCQQMFGREPPVFARPKAPLSPSVSQQHQNQSASAPSPSTPRHSQAATAGALTPSASFYSYNNGSSLHDARERPPPPAPIPELNQAAPHRPPKPSSSANASYRSPGPQSTASNPDYAPLPHSRPSPNHSQPQYSQTAAHDQNKRLSGANYGSPLSMPPNRASSINTNPSGPHSPQSVSAVASPSHRPWEQIPQRHPPMTQEHTAPQHKSYVSSQGNQTLNHRYSYQHQQQSPSPAPQSPSLNAQSQHQPPEIPNRDQMYAYHSQNGPAARIQVAAQSLTGTAPRASAVNLLDDDEPSVPRTSVGGANGEVSGAPPPPRPMNPELLAMHDRLLAKIESRLGALSSSLEGSDQQLRVLSSDLDRGKPAIEDEMSRLKAVRDVCQMTGDRLEETVIQARERVSSLRQREDPDPDTMVMATSIVGNQLIDLVAEDNAIGDTLYQLGRALNAERIDFDRFLKQTRMLARDQFMKRALAQKISEGMGWS